MCGIVGVISSDGLPVEADLFSRMCDTLAHRGPDDRGIRLFSFDRGPGAALGHTRLSILDLSPNGRQPMANEDGSVHLVCNGEIYNHVALRDGTEAHGHRYRSRTDVETILHLYEDAGIDCPEPLNGMFAFGVWDAGRRSLLLARDRSGIKPLYYAERDGRLAFASEIKALLPLPWVTRELDPEALNLYLSLLYIPAPWSIFRDIRKLPAGHRLVWRDGESKVEPYFGFPILDFGLRNENVQSLKSEVQSPKSLREAEAAEALLDHLDRSVRTQLQGDVPAGALLSGGLDSSLVVALMARHSGRPVPTFSIGFRGAGHYDERPHARRIARQFGTEHVEAEVDPGLSGLLPDLARTFDEPFGDSSAIPTYLIARTASRRVKVVLSGTGSDELLGGYRRHAAGPALRRLRRFPAPALRAASALLSLLPASRTSAFGERTLLARRLVDAARERDGRAYLRMITFMDERTLKGLRGDGSPGLADRLFADRTVGRETFLDRALAFDRAVYLPDDLLVKEDRMSMAVSVEGRVPFLDNDLMAFADSLPPSLKVRRGTSKALLKRAARGVLPDEVIDRPKHGFGVPISEWLRGDLAATGRELLRSLSGRGLLEAEAVPALWERHQRGEAELGPAIWGLMMLELWHREHVG